MRHTEIRQPLTSTVEPPEDQAVRAAQVVLAVLESPVVQAARVALVVLEKPAEPAGREAPVVSESPVVRAAPVVLERPVVPAAQVVPESPAVRVAPENPVVQVGPQPEQKLAVAEQRKPASKPGGGGGANSIGGHQPSKGGGGGGGGAFGGGSGSSAKAASNRGGSSMGGGGEVVEAAAAAAKRRRRQKRRRRGTRTLNAMNEQKTFRSKTMNSLKLQFLASVLAASSFVCAGLIAAPQPKSDTAAGAQPNQKQFNTPKEAADSLVQAAESFDVNALKEILGPDSTDIVTSEDPVQDKNKAMAFAAKAKEKTAIDTDPKNPNRAILTVGNDDFPVPIPIVKQKGKWVFDTKSGRQEILNRRIGTNELDAIAICRGFVEAQHEYAEEKRDGKANQYAQRIISTPGKHDGLAWQNADGTWGGPVGEAIARALEQGYSKKSEPFHGYYFKVLKGQGPAAPMGEMDFVVNGAMISGFALAAAPAQYRVTGVKTFMVGPNGVVYEKDLGPDTLKKFESVERYNPDKTWKPTDDDWPESEE